MFQFRLETKESAMDIDAFTHSLNFSYVYLDSLSDRDLFCMDTAKEPGATQQTESSLGGAHTGSQVSTVFR